MYREGADILGFAAGGSPILTLSSAQTVSYADRHVQNSGGSAAVPSYTWSGSPTTGLYTPSTGSMGISVSGTLKHRFQYSLTTSYTRISYVLTGTANIDFITFQNDGGLLGKIHTDGSNNLIYLATSDRRLKTNITSLTGGIAVMKALRPRTYDWIAGGQGVGFIADELQDVLPALVNGETNALNEDGSIKIQMIATKGIIPYLTVAIKELVAKVETLQADVVALQAYHV
jgi:hypothetical protein